MRNTCKGDNQKQLEPRIWIAVAPNHMTNRLNIWHGWLLRRFDTTCQKVTKSAP